MASVAPYIPPLYIVKQLKEVSHTVRSYGSSSKGDYWQVGIQRGSWALSRFDMFFQHEARAREFNFAQIYSAADMLKRAPEEGFVIQNVQAVKRYDIVNPYTGTSAATPGWKTTMMSPYGNILEVYSPYMQKYALGKEMTVTDLIATVPADPVESSAQLQQAADALATAKAIQDGLAEQQANTAQLQAQVTSLQKAQQAQIAALEAQAAVIAEEEAALVAEEEAAAAARAAAIAAQQRAEALFQALAYKNFTTEKNLGESTSAASSGTWAITNNGSSGYYDGVYYEAGFFEEPGFKYGSGASIPKNFTWKGSFVSAFAEGGNVAYY